MTILGMHFMLTPTCLPTSTPGQTLPALRHNGCGLLDRPTAIVPSLPNMARLRRAEASETLSRCSTHARRVTSIRRRNATYACSIADFFYAASFVTSNEQIPRAYTELRLEAIGVQSLQNHSPRRRRIMARITIVSQPMGNGSEQTAHDLASMAGQRAVVTGL